MSEFSLDANINITPEKILEVASGRHEDISTLVYSAISLNAPMDEMIFLYKYISAVATKYEAVLEYCGFFINRNNVQKYVDMIATVTLASISHFVKTEFNLPEAISFFINQFLKIVYENSEFNIINIKLIHSPGKCRLKILIEPILTSGEKLSDKDAEACSRLILLLLPYLETPDRCISISVVKSDTWAKNTEYIPDLIDDNMFPGIFEQYPALYKIVFKRRHEILKSLGIDSVDVSGNIKLPESMENMFNAMVEKDETDITDIAETMNELLDEYLEEDSADEIEEADLYTSQYSRIIEVLYGKITNKDFPVNVSASDVDPNHNQDVPVYVNIYKKLVTDTFGMWDIQNAIRTEYEEGSDDKFEYHDKQPEIHVEPIPKLNPEMEKHIADTVEKRTGIRKTDLDDFNIDLRIDLPEYVPTKDANGFSKFIFDYHDAEEVKNIIDISSYITDMIVLYIKTKDKFNQSVLNKIISSYTKEKTEVLEIKNNYRADNYTVEFNMSEHLYRFTISKKDGIIEAIESKEE